MDREVREHLRSASTATISTQLIKRGIRSCCMRGVHRLHPTMGRAVGPAYTLRYVPYREDRDPMGKLGDADNPARRAIEECPSGAVLVVDARGVAGVGTLGDILATRLAHRGVAGFVSDGGVRDVEALADIGLPIYSAGAAVPASAAAHVPVALDEPIACGGVAVFPGDIVVADGDGVVIVPAQIAAEVAPAAARQEEIEDFVQRLIASGRPVIGTYPPTDAIRAQFEAWIAAGKPALDEPDTAP